MYVCVYNMPPTKYMYIILAVVISGWQNYTIFFVLSYVLQIWVMNKFISRKFNFKNEEKLSIK